MLSISVSLPTQDRKDFNHRQIMRWEHYDIKNVLQIPFHLVKGDGFDFQTLSSFSRHVTSRQVTFTKSSLCIYLQLIQQIIRNIQIFPIISIN